MKQTAISQVAEQILNAVFSVLMAYLLTRPYTADELLQGKFGAAGGTIGTGAGVVTGLIIMLLAYSVSRGTIKKQLARDKSTAEESYKDVFRDILLMCTPIILATFVYNMATVVDQVIFTNLMHTHQYSANLISKLYGLFSYRARPIINIPIALASATSTALIPAVATSLAAKDKDGAVMKINECIRLTAFIAIPSAVGIAILSYPVMFALYPSGAVAGAAELLSWSAVSVIFYSLSTVMNGVLQGSGHPSIPVRNAAIALAVNAVVAAVMVGPLNLHIYGIVFAMVLYSFVVLILNMLAIRKHIGYLPDFRALLIPVKAALVMGAVVAVIYWVPTLLIPSVFERYIGSALLLVIAVLAGIATYFAIYGRITDLTDEEIRRLPMGTKILSLMRKLHVR